MPSTERVIGTKIKPISETKPGDVLPEGIVTNSWKTRDSSEILKITLYDGRQIRLTPDHLIQISEYSHRSTTGFEKTSKNYRYGTVFTKKWVRADQIKKDDFIEFPLGGSFSENDYPDEFIPLLAGLIWGDGCKAKGRAPCLYYDESNKDFAESVKKLSPYPFLDSKHFCRTETMRKIIWRKEIQKKLEDFGLIKSMPIRDRRIPLKIMNASKRDICKFISGWASTDGTISKNENYRRLDIYSASYDMLRDLQILLMKLGIKSSVKNNGHLSTKGNFGTDKVYKRAHQLSVSGSNLDNFYKQIELVDPIKQKKLFASCNSTKLRKFSQYGSKVKSVVSDGTAPVYDIEVSPSNMFNAEGFIVHNCSCWPSDSISTLIYPEAMKADILFISTPVNQATAHSQVWNVMQRFISLDGGYYIEELPVKDQAFRSKAIQLEKEHPRYDPRLFGKIWGYFVSSKDTHNMKSTKVSYGEEKEVDILDPVLKKFDRMSYEYGTVGTLAYQAAEYGGFHAEPYYVISGSNPDIGMSSDKATLSKDASSFQEAKNVVLSALRMAESFIDKPPTLDAVDRINRS